MIRNDNNLGLLKKNILKERKQIKHILKGDEEQKTLIPQSHAKRLQPANK